MRLRWLTVPAEKLERGHSGVDVHTADWDGPDGGPVFVCVHGLGGSHVNWSAVAPALAERGRVFAPDLAGFGLTPPTGRRATVDDNLDLLAGFVRTVSAGRPVILLGNSMGGLISLLLAAARPELTLGLVLVAPASPRPLTARFDPRVVANFALMGVPVLGEQWLARRQRRITPSEQVRETMALCMADPSVLDRELVELHVDIARQRRSLPYARAALLEAARSLLMILGPRQRRVWQAVADVQAPTLLLHGAQDRLVTAAGIAAMAKRRPDWDHTGYDDLGHIPMLEAPDRVTEDIRVWLERARIGGRVHL